MYGTYGMFETGMIYTGKNDAGKSKLFDSAQTLKKRVLYQVIDEFWLDSDESKNRIVDDLFLICFQSEKRLFKNVLTAKIRNFFILFFFNHLLTDDH